jgi:hypothetical protein
MNKSGIKLHHSEGLSILIVEYFYTPGPGKLHNPEKNRQRPPLLFQPGSPVSLPERQANFQRCLKSEPDIDHVAEAHCRCRRIFCCVKTFPGEYKIGPREFIF